MSDIETRYGLPVLTRRKQKEAIRRRLEDGSIDIIEAYVEGEIAARPVALEQLQQTVIPWFRALKTTEAYYRILQRVGNGTGHAPVSEAVHYEAPFNKIRELRKSFKERAPFGWQVSDLDVNQVSDEQVAEWLAPEKWITQFHVGYFTPTRWIRDRQEAVVVTHEGPSYSGQGRINIFNPVEVLETVGSRVVFGLVDQIKTGRIDRVTGRYQE